MAFLRYHPTVGLVVQLEELNNIVFIIKNAKMPDNGNFKTYGSPYNAVYEINPKYFTGGVSYSSYEYKTTTINLDITNGFFCPFNIDISEVNSNSFYEQIKENKKAKIIIRFENGIEREVTLKQLEKIKTFLD